MLTELVEQKLDAYTERKDELVELRAMRAGDVWRPFYDEDPFAPSPIELKKMREEEQDASLHSKEEASLTDKIADDVSARVDEMLEEVSGPPLAETPSRKIQTLSRQRRHQISKNS